MLAVVSLFIVVTVSILITRVATIALTHTGLSREAARFQARSAFTGAGFTTTESESVVNHPVRRRIIMLLMLVGNAGIVTAVSSLILTFVDRSDDGVALWLKTALLVTGLVGLWGLAASHWVDRHLSRVIDRALRRYTQLDVRDYSSLMHLVGEYRLVELQVCEGDWLAGKTLGESKVRDEGIVVLGVKRPDGTYIGAPKGPRRIEPGDTLLLYGRVVALEELDHREASPGAEREHEEAVREQDRVARAEEAQEARAEPG